MIQQIDINYILSLYNKYIDDLSKVRNQQKKLYSKYGYFSIEKQYWPRYLISNFLKHILNYTRMDPQLDDIEAEISYLLLRELKPETVVEISPCGGWSSTWILSALRDNGSGKLYSYDLIDTSVKMIPEDLKTNRWTFVQGDVKKNINKIPSQIDYLFIDSDHSADFAHWYINNVFPKLKNGIPISIHDVYHTADPNAFYKEGGVIVNWLDSKGIKYFTPSPAKEIEYFNRIMSEKKKLNIELPIHLIKRDNPMIYFVYQI